MLVLHSQECDKNIMKYAKLSTVLCVDLLF